MKELIESVRQIIENIEYKEIIEKHIDLENFKLLACELINLLWEKELENKKKNFVNGLVKDVKSRLKMRTSAIQIKDVDLYSFSMDEKRVARFTEIVGFVTVDIE